MRLYLARVSICALLAGLFLALFCGGASSARAQAAKRHVLYINSYQNGYTWSDDILAGFREVFNGPQASQLGIAVDLQVEYLDTKKFPDPELLVALRNHLERKFRDIHFDALLVSDNDAYDFALDYGQKLFPGVPLVFCGVNDYRPEALAGREDYTGVMESSRVADTLRIALRLHPRAKSVTVIGDHSNTSLAIEEQVRAAAMEFPHRLRFDYHRVESLQAVDDLLANLPDNALIFFIPFYIDQKGAFYSAEEVLSYIAEHTSTPIYSGWEFLLGHGMVGGQLLSGVQQGRVAAQMVLRILDGEPPRTIPVEEETDDPLVFDYNVLDRLKLDTDRLPENSILINEPQIFYELRKPVVWGIITALACLFVILVLLVVNIARRRQMELQVKDQLHFLRLLMDTIPIPLYFQDVSGTFGLFNSSFEQWFCRKSGKETCGGVCMSAQCKGLATLADSRDIGLLQKAGVTIYERSVKSVDGESHDVLVHKATHVNARGDIEGVVGVLYDITDRKRAEQSLRESQATLRTVLDTIPQLVYWKDAQGRFQGANRSFAEFFGLESHEEVVGLAGTDVFPETNARWGERLEKEIVRSGTSYYRFIREMTMHDGVPKTLEFNKVPLLNHQRTVVGVLSTAEDVTSKLNLERQLLQSQKMEAIGTFVSGIAHDFNNILTTIINSAELALLDVGEDSEVATDMRRALSAARQGSQLVKQIHTYSRPSREGLRPTALSRVIREALDLVRASLPGNIALSARLQDPPEAALADPSQIHQVLMNLCTNAFQAMRETGGAMEVALRGVNVDESEAGLLGIAPGRYLKLSVSDNGPGIPPEIRNKVFDPFFTTKSTGEGTGLGLAVVQGIINGHKGAIRLESEPFSKTVIDIYLPSAQKTETVQRRRETVVSGGDERILFVEDNQDQLATVPRMLRRLGYRVTACRGADEALRVLRGNGREFDLVVTDFDMPGMDGDEFSHALADLRPDLPVIMVSGRTEAPGFGENHAQNIRQVLAKPYNGQELSEAIRNLMGN